MLKIEPIKLLAGTHADTGTTGQGCFMNVIAYLNGEAQITDQSPCVCVTIRPIAIWLNDYLRSDERARMIPYIERAMGSATTDTAELVRRAYLAAGMAKTMSTIADRAASAIMAAWVEKTGIAATARWAESAARAARMASEESAVCAASVASAGGSARAARAATHASRAAASVAARADIINACFAFLDAALPKADITDPFILKRADTLVEIANAH